MRPDQARNVACNHSAAGAPGTTANSGSTDDALGRLYERGAHFVLCRPDKRPVGSAWQKNAPTLREAQEWPGEVGIIPASVGCVVLDVDEGGKDTVSELPTITHALPFAVVPSQKPGRFHAWFKSPPGEVPNGKWRTERGRGDVRGSAGYVILWDRDEVADALDAHWDGATAARLDGIERDAPLRALPADFNVDQLVDAIRGAEEGTRNNVFNSLVYQANTQRALTTEEIARVRQAALDAGLDAVEVSKTLGSAVGAGSAERTAKPRLPVNVESLGTILGMMMSDLRFNVRASSIELRREGATWTPLHDRNEARLRTDIADRFCNMSSGTGQPPWEPSTDKWTTLVRSHVDAREVDPFVTDYLLQLPPSREPVEFLWTWINELWDFDADPHLVAWVSQYLFLGPVQRSLEPGCKLDEMPVLVGPQNCGKSALCESIAPLGYGDLFTDDVDFRHSDKTITEALQGKLVVELSEMKGITYRDLDSLKAFITRRDDGVGKRLAYARRAESMPRRCVLAGTSNPDNVLPADPTGNRRFVPLKIQCDVNEHGRGYAKQKVELFIDAHRDDLFALALAQHQDGQRANLPKALHAAQGVEAGRHTPKFELLEDAVWEFLSEREEFRLKDLVEYVRQADPKATESQISGAARKLGWAVSAQWRDGKTVRIWTKT